LKHSASFGLTSLHEVVQGGSEGFFGILPLKKSDVFPSRNFLALADRQEKTGTTHMSACTFLKTLYGVHPGLEIQEVRLHSEKGPRISPADYGFRFSSSNKFWAWLAITTSHLEIHDCRHLECFFTWPRCEELKRNSLVLYSERRLESVGETLVVFAQTSNDLADRLPASD